MSNNISNKILENHYVGMINASQFVELMFEEVSFLNERKHIDNPQVLSLMLEFFGPFKKKSAEDDDQGDQMASKMLSTSTRSKEMLKNLKGAIATAAKAPNSMKSVDLTNVEDVRSKIGALVKAVMDVGQLQMNVVHDTSLEPEELDAVLDPVKASIDSLYTLAAYKLNVIKSSIDQHIKELEKVVPPGVLKGAAVSHKQKSAPVAKNKPVVKSDDAEMDAMKKKIMTPWAKHIGNFFGNAQYSSPVGTPGAMRMREGKEELEND